MLNCKIFEYTDIFGYITLQLFYVSFKNNLTELGFLNLIVWLDLVLTDRDTLNISENLFSLDNFEIFLFYVRKSSIISMYFIKFIWAITVCKYWIFLVWKTYKKHFLLNYMISSKSILVSEIDYRLFKKFYRSFRSLSKL